MHVKRRSTIVGRLFALCGQGHSVLVLPRDLLRYLSLGELLAVTSAFLVFARRTSRQSKAAGIRFTWIIQVLSGV